MQPETLRAPAQRTQSVLSGVTTRTVRRLDVGTIDTHAGALSAAISAFLPSVFWRAGFFRIGVVLVGIVLTNV
jgi:hypothetical protein